MTAEPTPAKAPSLAALGQPTPADRAAFLDRQCAGDPALRERVEGLLRAHDGRDSLLDRPLVGPPGGETRTAPRSDAADPPGDVPLMFLAPAREAGSLGWLDHYEVLEVVGRGGMGVVLRARDTKLHRVVAIKVLAPELAAGGTARRRVVREAQAAAAVRDE